MKVKGHYTTTVAAIHLQIWLTRAFYHKTTFKGFDQNSATGKKIPNKPADFHDMSVTECKQDASVEPSPFDCQQLPFITSE